MKDEWRLACGEMLIRDMMEDWFSESPQYPVTKWRAKVIIYQSGLNE